MRCQDAEGRSEDKTTNEGNNPTEQDWTKWNSTGLKKQASPNTQNSSNCNRGIRSPLCSLLGIIGAWCDHNSFFGKRE